MSPEILRDLVLVLVPLILSLAVHEYAHAATAYWLGDDTAALQGRFTLNPMSHIDPMGSLVVPGLLVVMGAGVWFGWAKPVPFNPVRFTRRIRMKHAVMLTAAAGPLSNLALAVICALAHGVLGANESARELLHTMVFLNVALFLFNLLPIHPLDGGKVLMGLLPDSAATALAPLAKKRGLNTVAFILVFMFAGRIIGPPLMGISSFLLNTLG